MNNKPILLMTDQPVYDKFILIVDGYAYSVSEKQGPADVCQTIGPVVEKDGEFWCEVNQLVSENISECGRPVNIKKYPEIDGLATAISKKRQ